MTDEQKQNLRRWIAALRSGKYKQGTGALKKFDDAGVIRYCCLGVGCDVRNPDGWHRLRDSQLFDYDGNTETIAGDTARFLGIDFAIVPDLVRMNDRNLTPFPDIAAHLESQFPEVFAEASA